MNHIDRRCEYWLSLIWLGLLTVGAFGAGLFHDPLEIDPMARLAPPNPLHWLGTDELGRDVLARLLAAVTLTAEIVGAASAIALILGATLGTLAACFPGLIDRVILRLIDLFWSVPVAVFAVLVLAATDSRVAVLVIAIAGVNWVGTARIFRSTIVQLRRSEFVRFARSMGFTPLSIIVWQIAPHLRIVGFTLAGYAAAETLALESGLAFLGLSLPPPTPTWGGMIADGLAYLSVGWWIAAAPSVALVATLASLRTIVTALNDGIDR